MSVKVVLDGHPDSQKTMFLQAFVSGEVPGDKYCPSVFENFRHEYNKDGDTVTFHVWDTPGQDEFDRLRPITYQNADFILAFYHVARIETLKLIKERGIRDYAYYCKNVPVILVGVGAECFTDSSEIRNEDALIPLNDVKNFVEKNGIAAWTMVSVSKLHVYSPFDIVFRYATKGKKGDGILAYIGDENLIPPSLKNCSYDIFESIGQNNVKTVAFFFRKDRPEELKELAGKYSFIFKTFKPKAKILFAGAPPLEPLNRATEEALKEAINFAKSSVGSGEYDDTSNLSKHFSHADGNCTIA